MTNFKTAAEIYQALLDGKKVYQPEYDPKYIHLVDGFLTNELGERISRFFNIPEHWTIWEPPPPKEYTFHEVLDMIYKDHTKVFERVSDGWKIKFDGTAYVNQYGDSFPVTLNDFELPWIEVTK